MAQEVLLMDNVPNLGSEGDVVTVADGYARNYLLPQELAAPVTEATRRRLAKLQAQRAEQRAKQKKVSQAVANRLKQASCTIAAKAGEDQKLYGSVSTTDIADALNQQGIEIDRHAVILENPIKELGCYDINIKLPHDVTATIKVWVVEE